MVHKFQFHKGTIRTDVTFRYIIFFHNFNSIKVQLEHTLFVGEDYEKANFNSIKVQLEHKSA